MKIKMITKDLAFFVDYQQATYDDPTFWYIRFDQSLEVVLGQPTEFEVTTPPDPF